MAGGPVLGQGEPHAGARDGGGGQGDGEGGAAGGGEKRAAREAAAPPPAPGPAGGLRLAEPLKKSRKAPPSFGLSADGTETAEFSAGVAQLAEMLAVRTVVARSYLIQALGDVGKAVEIYERRESSARAASGGWRAPRRAWRRA